ncbi:VanZ family protein [Cytobacillus sp. FJAT-54145]|uniref:VanZ family protein n=1 Tax=Cytobacillus spartinae TaxID=3299023 RepID=A0ABW6KE44_9BACI
MKILKKWIFTALPFAYMILIWTLSSLPHNAVVELPDSAVDRFIKESLHLVEFGILYLLFVFLFLNRGTFNEKISMICAIVAGLYGVVDEIHQSFVPYRSASIIDVIKDVIGVVVAYIIIKRSYFQGRYPFIKKLLIKLS